MKLTKIAFFLGLLCAIGSLDASISVRLSTGLPTPQLVGTTIVLSYGSTDSNPGPVTYRLEVGLPQSGSYQMVNDFKAKNTYQWTPNVVDGLYNLRVTARDQKTNEVAQQVVQFLVSSRIVSNAAAVTATQHPLVALFSAPNCAAGSSMRVTFQNQGGNVVSTTDTRPCHPGSQNFYIVGMMASSTYNMNYIVVKNGLETPGPKLLTWVTGAVPASFHIPPIAHPVPLGSLTSQSEKFVLSSFSGLALPFAADIKGNIVWYWTGSGTPQLNRPRPGGTILAIGGEAGDWTGTGPYGHQTKSQLLWEVDYAGNILRETNADCVNEQLLALGNTDPISHFNHENFRMPNGYTVAIADVQKIYPTGTQGSTSPVDIIGTMLIVLDQNFQVRWFWNSFDHTAPGELDINRAATLGETCTVTGNARADIGCPPALNLPIASDWLHANSAVLTTDGNILVSLRHQDWLIKVDYSNGAGTGRVMWKMGVGGDFTVLNSSDPYPWFSHQHEAAYEQGGNQIISVFDNGNLRNSLFGGNSRGQVWSIDETQKTATPILNADLGAYSTALGSAQLLANGDYMFGAGNVNVQGLAAALSVEVSASGTPTYSQEVAASAYRCWRLLNFYNPPLN